MTEPPGLSRRSLRSAIPTLRPHIAAGLRDSVFTWK
jgi:hypothetical protein